jgi:peptidoglycan hydrolase-like protein with peptidoglycan-binding domain
MQFGQFILVPTVLLALAIPAAAATHSRRSPTSSSKAFSKHAAKPKVQSQRGIDDERATQIQAALIKAGYLSGTPSGHWDTETQAAMEKVQADNGWQTKLVPDSRALIKLGLGPSTASPEALASQPVPIAANRSNPLARP